MDPLILTSLLARRIPSCDTVPEESVGVYLGFALSGTSIGLAIGPPVRSIFSPLFRSFSFSFGVFVLVA